MKNHELLVVILVMVAWILHAQCSKKQSAVLTLVDSARTINYILGDYSGNLHVVTYRGPGSGYSNIHDTTDSNYNSIAHVTLLSDTSFTITGEISLYWYADSFAFNYSNTYAISGAYGMTGTDSMHFDTLTRSLYIATAHGTYGSSGSTATYETFTGKKIN